MNRGRNFLPPIGRSFRQEVLFTFRSLFATLPAYRSDLFFDERGRELEVDLFDPESWRRYGWSVFDPRVERRLARRGRVELFGDEEWRFAYLTEMLDRARRLHALLMQDVEELGTRYYLVQSEELPTADRVVLAENDGKWKSYVSGDRRIKKDPRLASLLSSPGDGLATVDSQAFLSSQEKTAIVGGCGSVPSRHRKMIRHPETRRLVLEHLAELPPPLRASSTASSQRSSSCLRPDRSGSREAGSP
jgi:hypothetical protein